MRSGITKVLILALVLRLLFVVLVYVINDNFSIIYSQDSSRFTELAKSLVYKKSFTSHGSVELEKLPGYPLLLAIGIVFGHPRVITILLQILLSCLSIYLIYKIANLIFKNEKLAIISSLFYSVEPLSILYTVEIMTETLFVTLLLLFFYFFVIYLDNNKLLFIILSSSMLAMSAYVRPVSIYLSILLASVLFIYFFVRRMKKTVKIFHPLIFLITFSILVGFWYVRNFALATYPHYSALGSRSVYIFSISILSEKKKVSPFKLGYEYLDKNYSGPGEAVLNNPDVYRYVDKEAKKIILNNLPSAFARYFKNMIIILTSPSTIEFCRLLSSEGKRALSICEKNYFSLGFIETEYKIFKECKFVFWSQFLLFSVLFLYYFFSVISITFYRHKSTAFFIIIFIALYFLFLSSLSFGMARYRFPIMPFLSILAGSGYCLIFSKRKKGNSQ